MIDPKKLARFLANDASSFDEMMTDDVGTASESLKHVVDMFKGTEFESVIADAYEVLEALYAQNS